MQMQVNFRHSEKRLIAKSNLLAIAAGTLFFGLLLSCALYGLFGQRLLESLYTGQVPWLRDRIMRGRGIYPLEAYYQELHNIMVLWTL